jgi:pantoate kinase
MISLRRNRTAFAGEFSINPSVPAYKKSRVVKSPMPADATSPAARVARAFAPGHVTGVFAPDLSARDPRGRGSVGAGVVLELGVWATVRWRPGTRRSEVRILSDAPGPLPISAEVARRLLGDRPGRLEVQLRHELPIGQGFGMSAAGALATGLAVARALGSARQRAIETAHLADLFGGGGLGGVSAVLGGGLELRERPGVPPFGRTRHRPFSPSILLAVVGRPLPSPPLLRDRRFLERVRAQANLSLPRLRTRTDAPTFLDEAERFTDGLGLASPPVRRVLTKVRATGARAAQAMFGQSVFIVPADPVERRAVVEMLEKARIRAVELRAARNGATSSRRAG